MKKLVFFAVFATLSACGVDGEPVSPRPQDAPEPGITISGDARIGVVKKF